MISRRALAYLGSIIALIVVAAACGPSQEATPTPVPTTAPVAQPVGAPTPTPTPVGAPKRGGVLQYREAADPPHFSVWEVSLETPANPAHNGLVRYDPYKEDTNPDTIIGDLAKSWEISADGKTYTFNLRSGVKWHDGTPFTSADAAFTLDVLRTPAAEQEALGKKYGGQGAVLKVTPFVATHANIASLETPNDHTLVVRVKRPQASFLTILVVEGSESIMSKRFALSKPFALQREVMGTGAFKFVSYEPGEKWVVERNPDYWDAPRPFVDKVVDNYIANEGNALAAFRTGKLHYMNTQSVDASMVVVKERPDTVLYPRTRLGISSLWGNADLPQFKSQKVHKAMSLAIDRKAMEAAVSRGTGTWKAAYMPPGYWGLPEAELDKLPEFAWPIDKKIAEAKKLMAEAGYTNGFKATAVTWPIPLFVNTAIVAKDALRAIGIEMEIKTMERGAWYEAMAVKNYEMAVFSFGAKINDPDGIFYEFYYCGSPRNYSTYCHQQVTDLIDKQSQTIDPNERRRLVWEIQKLLMEDPFVLQVSWDGRVDMLAAELKGWIPKKYPGGSSAYNTRWDTAWLDK